MAILGISDSHNAAAALLDRSGRLLALQEERPTREKNFSGMPDRSVAWLLAEAGLRPEEVEAVAVANLDPFRPMDRGERLRSFGRNATLAGRLVSAARRTPVMQGVLARRRADRMARLRALGFAPGQVVEYDHHLCHAATAAYGADHGPDPVLVITCDGAGDGLCATVSVLRDGMLERRHAVEWSHSFGVLYAVVTYMLGMVPNEHEYKIMGMAPYASPSASERVSERLLALFEWDEGGAPVWRRARGVPHMLNVQPTLERLFHGVRFDAVMGGVQMFTEEMLREFVRRAVAATGVGRVAASGGVFMNVKANKAILEMPQVESLFVFPSCGDETNAIGAAWLAQAARSGPATVAPLRSMYLGPEWGEDAILAALRPAEAAGWLEVERPADVNAATVECLVRGEVVARFAGREEFGARSLGNRAILADPRRPEVIQVINDLVKSRDFWMPFAASVMAEHARDYMVMPKGVTAPYMILSFDTTEAGWEALRAGTHPYDRTCRPQVVTREDNPDYWDLLRRFRDRTGVGGLLNTSLNLHGLPLVHTPADALEVLERSGLSRLAIGPFLATSRLDREGGTEALRRTLAESTAVRV